MAQDTLEKALALALKEVDTLDTSHKNLLDMMIQRENSLQPFMARCKTCGNLVLDHKLVNTTSGLTLLCPPDAPGFTSKPIPKLPTGVGKAV